MPNYIVVCCYQCKLFQGQQENKQKKFKCKVCGEKQSVRHVFARSDYPKDIRGVVQELNQKRVEMLDKEQPTQQQFAELSLDDEEEYIQPRKDNGKQEQGKSIWAAFVDEPVQKEDVQPEDPRFVTDISSLFPSSSQSRKRRENRSDRKETIKTKNTKREEVNQYGIEEEDEFILPHSSSVSSSVPSSRRNEVESISYTKRSSEVLPTTKSASWINKRQHITTNADEYKEANYQTPSLFPPSSRDVHKPQSVQPKSPETISLQEEGPIFVTDLENDLQEYQRQSPTQEESISQQQPKKNSLWSSFL